MACKLYCSKASTKQILCTRSSISWRRSSPKASASPLPPALHKTLKYKCGHLKHFFLQLWEMNRILEGSVFRGEVFFFPICGILHPKEHRKVNEYYWRNMSSCSNCAHVTVGTGKQGLSPLRGDQFQSWLPAQMEVVWAVGTPSLGPSLLPNILLALNTLVRVFSKGDFKASDFQVKSSVCPTVSNGEAYLWCFCWNVEKMLYMLNCIYVSNGWLNS